MMQDADTPPQQQQRLDRRPKIFLSYRMHEARRPAWLLRRALQERDGVDVFMCGTQPGDSITDAVAAGLTHCDLAVILGTRTYGQKTNAAFSTHEELEYIMAERIPFFLIKMCHRFAVDTTRFHFANRCNSIWRIEGVMPDSLQLPPHLVREIVTKLSEPTIRAGPQHQPRSQPRAQPQLAPPLKDWLQQHGLLYSVGFALYDLGIHDIQALDAATETFRNIQERIQVNRAMEQGKRAYATVHTNEGVDSHRVLLLLESTLRNQGVGAAETGRFVRACKLAAWGQEVGASEEVDAFASAVAEQPPPPRRQEAVNENVFWGNLNEVDNPEQKQTIHDIWQNACGEDVSMSARHQLALSMAGVRALAEALKANTTLTTLSLQSSFIGAGGARLIAQALRTNKTLLRLLLGYNQIGDEGAKDIGEALKSNNTLVSLDLNENGVGVEGARVIADMLKINEALTWLHLGYNKIQDEGVQLLGEALEGNSTLKALHLEDNGISDTGARVLAEVLNPENPRTQNRLTDLYLGDNKIEDVGARVIGRALETNSTLRTLSLPLNKIHEEGARDLLESLASNTALTSIGINRNPMPDDLESQINNAVALNKQRHDGPAGLLQFGSVPLSTAKVFVCGDYGIGKTTLIRALQRQVPPQGSRKSETAAAIMRLVQPLVQRALSSVPCAIPEPSADELDHPCECTPGIELRRLTLKRQRQRQADEAVGSRSDTVMETCDLQVYDFGGHLEYHALHELLPAHHNVVFVLCVDISKPFSSVQERMMHWLSFIKTRLHQSFVHSNEPPRVIVVGTKADKPHPEHDFAEREGTTIFDQGDKLVQNHGLQSLFADSMRIHPHLIPLNCHDAESANMHCLRDLLHAVWADVVQRDYQAPRVVEHIARALDACRHEHDGPWAVDTLLTTVQEHVPTLSAEGFTKDVFFKALSYLHVRGDILWFTRMPSLRDYVFVSPSWLLSNVVGPALAPEHFVITHLSPRDGEVSLQEIEHVFGELVDPNMVVDVLCNMLLCFQLSPHFLLPSRLKRAPPELWAADTCTVPSVFGGRRFVIRERSGMIFPPGLFPRLQSRMAALLTGGINMWRNMFKGLYGNVECFGRIEGDQAIDLWVRAPGQEQTDQEEAWLALLLMIMELEEEAGRITYEHHVLSYAHLSAYRRHPAGYPIKHVEAAIARGDRYISRDVRTNNDTSRDEEATAPELVRDEVQNLLREGCFLEPL